MVQEFEKLVVFGPKGSFEPPVSEPKLKVEPINDIFPICSRLAKQNCGTVLGTGSGNYFFWQRSRK
jgi:hypothetical protein